MRRFFVYLGAQCKRAARLLPHALLITALLCAAAALAAAVISAGRAGDASRQLALVGVVGDESDPYVRIGIDALETFDTSREEMKFVFLDEETGVRELRAGRLSALMYLPEDFVENIYAGTVQPIRFLTPEGSAGLDSLLTAELADAVAQLMTETENAQFGAQEYARDYRPELDPYEVDNELVDRYFAMVLSRGRLFSVKTVGLSDNLSFAGYYFCGLAVAFLLLMGLGGAPLAAGRSAELGLTLRAQGFGAAPQVLGEFVAYYLLMLLSAAAAGAAGWFLLQRSALTVPELGDVSPAALLKALTLLVLCLSAMQFFLYELAPGALAGGLLQFLCAAVQAYICGCFYPYTFFPDALQKLGAALPAHAALRYLSGVLRLTGGFGPSLALWALAFLVLTVAVRAWRLRR